MAKPAPITIPTEPIGSIPRPVDLIERVAKGDSEDPNLAPLYEEAIRDTIERFEATGSPVVTDSEQRKYHNFCTYCVHGLPNTLPDGFKIAFSDGHTRRLSRLTRGPFRYLESDVPSREHSRLFARPIHQRSTESTKPRYGGGARETVNF
jgi:5-methyltetrahydropteroyltriglutamate--homocysteine methyltransferase